MYFVACVYFLFDHQLESVDGTGLTVYHVRCYLTCVAEKGTCMMAAN